MASDLLTDEMLNGLSIEELNQITTQLGVSIEQLENALAKKSDSAAESAAKEFEQKKRVYAKKRAEYIERLRCLDFELAQLERQLPPLSLNHGERNDSEEADTGLYNPAVNHLYEKLIKACKDTAKRLGECEQDLQAWRFSPESNNGKYLVAKLRSLLSENERLGEAQQSDQIAQLELQNSVHKTCMEELSTINANLTGLIPLLDLDMEGLQSCLFAIQKELKTSVQLLDDLKQATQTS